MTKRYIWLTALLTALTIGSARTPAQQATQPVAPAPTEQGEALFIKKCAQCHSLAKDKNGNGPSLHRIIDRQAASVPGFKYSRAMQQLAKEDELEWTEENLAMFLEKPSLLVPGTRMAFPGMKQQEDIEILISWIKANSGPPAGRP